MLKRAGVLNMRKIIEFIPFRVFLQPICAGEVQVVIVRDMSYSL